MTKSMKITVSSLLMLFSALVFAADGDRSGMLKGLNNHTSTGTVTVIVGDSGSVINFSEDFTFDGAPDPKVAFGKDGKYDPATLIEPLKSNTGAQQYTVPEGLNVADYNEVYIWCERYSVGLAVAAIQ